MLTLTYTLLPYQQSHAARQLLTPLGLFPRVT